MVKVSCPVSILNLRALVFIAAISSLAILNAELILTPEDIKAIAEFRPLVQDLFTHEYQTTDGYLLRFLKAKKMDVKEAVEMFSEAQKWRAENNIDSITNESFPEAASFVFRDDGIDYEGRRVITFSLGNYDLRKVILSGNRNRYLRFMMSTVEGAVSKAAEAVYRSNGTLTDSRLVSISDLQGFSIKKHACLACIKLYAENANLVEKYYPGIAALSVHINTPRSALPMIHLVLNFVKPETRDAVKIFGSNRTEYTDYIRKIVPAEQITYEFGGTRVD